MLLTSTWGARWGRYQTPDIYRQSHFALRWPRSTRRDRRERQQHRILEQLNKSKSCSVNKEIESDGHEMGHKVPPGETEPGETPPGCGLDIFRRNRKG